MGIKGLLEIQVYLDDELLGVGSNYRRLERDYFKIENFISEKRNGFYSKGAVDIEIKFNKTHVTWYSFGYSAVKLTDQLVIKTSFSFAKNEYIMDDFLKILNCWDRDLKINWRQLDKNGRKGWIVACLHYSGTNPKLIDKKYFVLDCTFINDEIDFYCLIGETLCGERGYLGQGLDGLTDCLRAVPFEGRFIELRGFKRLSNCLNTKSFAWTDNVIEILERSFKLILN